jgi:hypothetical protein
MQQQLPKSKSARRTNRQRFPEILSTYCSLIDEESL